MVRKRQHEQATTDQWPVDLGRIRFGLIGLFGQVFPIKYVINSKRFRLWANSPKLRERFRLLDLPAPQNLRPDGLIRAALPASAIVEGGDAGHHHLVPTGQR